MNSDRRLDSTQIALPRARSAFVLIKSDPGSCSVTKNGMRPVFIPQGDIVGGNAPKAVSLDIATQHPKGRWVRFKSDDSTLRIEPLEEECGHPDIRSTIENQRLRCSTLEQVLFPERRSRRTAGVATPRSNIQSRNQGPSENRNSDKRHGGSHRGSLQGAFPFHSICEERTNFARPLKPSSRFPAAFGFRISLAREHYCPNG